MRRGLGRTYYLSQIIMESSLIVLGLAAAAGVWKCVGRGKVFSRGAQGRRGQTIGYISINLNMLERGGGTLRARDHQHH